MKKEKRSSGMVQRAKKTNHYLHGDHKVQNFYKYQETKTNGNLLITTALVKAVHRKLNPFVSLQTVIGAHPLHFEWSIQ